MGFQWEQSHYLYNTIIEQSHYLYYSHMDLLHDKGIFFHVTLSPAFLLLQDTLTGFSLVEPMDFGKKTPSFP